jgi:TetR/AcrR family transcriptional regulator, cholesterol catabolism regulator
MESATKILNGATELFFRLGVKSITMDDIARELGISKKTLYQHFEDKREIILQMCHGILQHNLKIIESAAKTAKDPVHEIIETGNQVNKIFTKINPVLIYDLKRYYPEAWQLLEEFKQKHILKILENNLKRGINMKIYRADLNVSLMARYRLAQFDLALNQDIFPDAKINMGEIQIAILDHFLIGITTLKGHKLLNKYKKLKE